MEEKKLSTQERYPWRATVRTVFAAAISIAALAAPIYQAATQHDPAEATGLAAVMLAACGAITRVLALPGVESFLKKFFPWLATGESIGD